MAMRFMNVALVCGVVVLSGCGANEPSAADIEKLVRDDAAKMKNVEVHEVRKIACAKAESEAGFMCDIEVDLTSPDIFWGKPKRVKSIRKFRLINDNGTWRVGI